MRLSLADVGATAAAGEALGQLVAGGDVIALVGELGAGKTSFTRGLDGLDYEEFEDLVHSIATAADKWDDKLAAELA